MDLNSAKISDVYSAARQYGSSGRTATKGTPFQDGFLSTSTVGEADNVGTKSERASKSYTYTSSNASDDVADAGDASKNPLVYSLKMLKSNSSGITKQSGSSDATSLVNQKTNSASVSAAFIQLDSTNSTSHGGANVYPDDIASPAAAAKMIKDLKAVGGGTLRIQMTHDQVNDSQEMKKLEALVDEGDRRGVKVQFTYRADAHRGGATVLTGDKLKKAADDISKVIKSYGKHSSFVLDTFNEGGGAGRATQDWADMQTTLIKSARRAGYKGSIAAEDVNWAGGQTAGPESGLLKYAAQLKAANGKGNPRLIGSIHEYANDTGASVRLGNEIDSLMNAGYKVQIGEVGNARWIGNNQFEERDGAIKAVKDNLATLRKIGVDILPWRDQFQNNVIRHNTGFSKGDQYY